MLLTGAALADAGCDRPYSSGEIGGKPVAASSVPVASGSARAGDSLPSAKTKLKGTPLSMVVPAGFQPATRFNGFSGPGETTMIMVSSLPASADEPSAMWSSEKLRSQNMTLVRKERVRVSGVDADLALVTQRTVEAPFEKWILVFPVDGQVFLCVAAYPAARHGTYRMLMRDALMSVSHDSSAVTAGEPLFHVSVSDMKLAHRLSGTEIYTSDGTLRQSSREAPLLTVGPSVAKIAPKDHDSFAQQRLRQTAQTTIVRVESHEPLTVDRLSGYETLATASDTSTGTPLKVYQAMLFADDHYFILQGIVGDERAGASLPRFREAARSLRRGPPPTP